MEKNIVKEKLRGGQAVIGTFARMNSISAEILGRTGWDFVIIDMEHGVYTMQDAAGLIRAAKAVGLSPIVRVPGTAPIHVMRALDAGADGVQIPQLTNLEQIKAVCEAARYYPEGQRGMCAYGAAAGYSTIPFDEHMKTSNREALVVIHIENEWSAAHISDILEIPGIDVVFCGPNDMSQSMGIPNQLDNPRLTALLDGVFETCRRKNVPTGIFVRQPEMISRWLECGVRYLTCSVDVGMYAEIARAKSSKLRSMIEEYSLKSV